MKQIIADIDTDLLLAAAFPKETPEEAEFRRIFGRSPDDADRQTGLTRVIQIAEALETVDANPKMAKRTVYRRILAAIKLAGREVQS